MPFGLTYVPVFYLFLYGAYLQKQGVESKEEYTPEV